MIALCLLCRNPTEIWCSFLSKCLYDVWVVVDYPLPLDTLRYWKGRYPSITFLSGYDQDEMSVREAGFVNINFIMRKDITAWERGLYHFAVTVQGKYDHVWFFEDDVFIPTASAIYNLDLKYPESDLLSNTCWRTQKVRQQDWHWSNIDIPFPPPYWTGMMCIVRMSQRFLSLLRDYGMREKTFFFLEAMFPTLVKRSSLVHHCPREFASVVYRKTYHYTDIRPECLYHPIKNLNDQAFYRQYLAHAIS